MIGWWWASRDRRIADRSQRVDPQPPIIGPSGRNYGPIALCEAARPSDRFADFQFKTFGSA